jgi:uncharacterized membrane protein YkoI
MWCAYGVGNFVEWRSLMKMHAYVTAAILSAGLSASVIVMAEETQQQLQSEAKVTESAARATALARVPHAVVQTSELEREKGKLVYSYDLSTPKSKNVTEVQIDAITGRVVGVIVETPKDQAKETAADKKGSAQEKQ